MTATRLYVCETCARDVPVPAGAKTPGRQLADAVSRQLDTRRSTSPIVYRTVICLNGCPRPCNAALRAPGKWSFRLGRLTPSDAEPVVDLLLEYLASPDGDVKPERWPAGLRDKVSVRTPPFVPGAIL